MRSLKGERSRRPLWAIGGVVLLLGAWGAWFFCARITVYEVSAEARLEVDRAVHPLAATVSGRVIATHLSLGRSVEANEVLVELDAETERRRLDEEKRRLAALQPQLEAVRRETAAQEQSLRDDREATRSALDGAHSRQTEAEASARFADEQARRLAMLKEGISELELSRARSEGEKKRAAAAALGTDVHRMEGDLRTRDSQGRARVEQLRRDAAQLDGQLGTSLATIRVLEEEVDKHLIRAPAAGQLGEIAALQIGSVLREGERIGTVVPSGELKVVAEYPPAPALGRVRRGQPARVRLEGFPWMQYGSLSARVENVASETRNGRVRVDLEVLSDRSSTIPLQHGLPGSVEIEVERVAPATLVLRAAGQLLSRPTTDPSPSPVSRSESR